MTEKTLKSTAPSRSRRYVGEAVLRGEDQELLQGRGGFLPDLAAPNAAEICIVRSTEPHALLRAIRPERPLALPGVSAVLTATDLDLVNDVPPCVDMIPGTLDARHRVIARDRV